MNTEHRPQQPPVPINVGSWSLDEDYPVFPVGSKPKRLLVCPEASQEPFLIPGHKYLFKVARGWQAYQIWSEVIAYELARPLGWTVPPCFLAVDGGEEVGVLVEFFYGYPDDRAPPRLVHGSDILQGLIQGAAYNQKTGRPHVVRTNIAVARVFNVNAATAWWAKAFAFDTLIGNTDRHPENWGILITRPTAKPIHINTAMAPIFDNGTSLGYEQTDEALSKPWPESKIASYIAKGTHHCTWSKDERQGTKHIEMCRRFNDAYPGPGADMRNVILLRDSHIEAVVHWCAEFDVPLPFPMRRAEFVSKLVRARRDLLAQALGA